MSSTRSAVFFIALILIQHNGSYADCNENDNNCQKQRKGILNALKETVSEASENGMLVFGLKTFAVATAAIVAAPAVVGFAGFGTAGIVGGSLAATVQASWFGGFISGGSVFAGLQSIGAAGLGFGAKSAIVATSGAALKAYEYVSGTSKESENESCSEKSVDNNNKLC